MTLDRFKPLGSPAFRPERFGFGVVSFEHGPKRDTAAIVGVTSEPARLIVSPTAVRALSGRA